MANRGARRPGKRKGGSPIPWRLGRQAGFRAATGKHGGQLFRMPILPDWILSGAGMCDGEISEVVGRPTYCRGPRPFP